MDHRDGRGHLDPLSGVPAPDAFDALDATVFRRVIGNFMTGVVVITTLDDAGPRGIAPAHDPAGEHLAAAVIPLRPAAA